MVPVEWWVCRGIRISSHRPTWCDVCCFAVRHRLTTIYRKFSFCYYGITKTFSFLTVFSFSLFFGAGFTA
jgi:hypothetical protein